MFTRRALPGRHPDRAANAMRVAELIRLRAQDTRRLSQQDYRDAGARYRIEPAALHAFADVECATGGFSPDGRLMILYEPHVFHRCTRGMWEGCTVTCVGGQVSASYPKWVPVKAGALPPRCDVHPYQLDQLSRWGLLAFAAEMDFDGALQACSWGAFQVLGENYRALGYPTPWHFVCAMYEGELAQLDAAIRYLESRDVLDAMRKGDWRKVIAAWNGPGQVDYYLKRFASRLDQRRKAYA